MSCNDDGLFPLGSIVTVTRGKGAGARYAVIAKEADRILIADGRSISAKRPKRKNPRHLRDEGFIAVRVSERLFGGKLIDDGWLVSVLREFS